VIPIAQLERGKRRLPYFTKTAPGKARRCGFFRPKEKRELRQGIGASTLGEERKEDITTLLKRRTI